MKRYSADVGDASPCSRDAGSGIQEHLSPFAAQREIATACYDAGVAEKPA
jgi:hypothetical protein